MAGKDRPIDIASLDRQPSFERSDEVRGSAPLPQSLRKLFGRDDLTVVYRRARDCIVRRGIFRLVTLVTEPDGAWTEITICNLWRIRRAADGTVALFEFSLAQETWAQVNGPASLENWPNLPIFPIASTRSLEWWRDVARTAIWKALA